MKRGISYLCLLFFIANAYQAIAQYNVKSCWMVIKGTSNLHDWESNVTQVRGNGELTIEPNTLKEIKSLYVEIPVRGIKSTKGSIMDGKTYDALKSGSCPQITYKLLKIKNLSPMGGGGYNISAWGELTIAGVTKQTDLLVTAKVDQYGTAVFSGSKKMKMTDFQIKPPTALLGTLTVGDDIEIQYSLTLSKY